MRNELAVAGFDPSSILTDDGVVTVPALNGLDDFGALDGFISKWVKLTGVKGAVKATAASLKLPFKAAKGVVRLTQRKLGTQGPGKMANARGMAGALRSRGVAGLSDIGDADTSEVTPDDLLTPHGAAKIGAAGQRAQAASRLHHANAQRHQKKLRDIQGRAKKASPQQRAQLEAEASVTTRALLEEKTSAERANVVAGSVLASLKFRKQALGERDPAKRKARLGQAEAALRAGKAAARTQVKVALPAGLTKGALQRKAQAAGHHQPPSFAAMGGRRQPIGLTRQVPRSAHLDYDPFGGEGDPAVLSTLGGLGGGNLGGLLDDILKGVGGAAQAIFPANGVVNNALNSTWGQVAAGAVAVGGALLAGKKLTQPAVPLQPQPYNTQQVQYAITQSSAQVAPPGMMSSLTGGMPGWVIPAGIGGVGLVAALLLI